MMKLAHSIVIVLFLPTSFLTFKLLERGINYCFLIGQQATAWKESQKLTPTSSTKLEILNVR